MENKNDELVRFLERLRSDIDEMKQTMPLVHDILYKLERIEEHVINGKSVISFNETMKLLGVSQNTLYKYMAECNLPSYKPEGIVYFDVGEIIEWIKRYPNGRQSLSERKRNTENYRKRRRKNM